MIASDSHSRIVGMDFFHSLPVPELWEWIFFIPFPFPNFGNRFFHSLPIPEFWEWFFFIPFPFPNWGNGFFQFPSRSRTSGMELSIPVPVPELPNVIPAHPCLLLLLMLMLRNVLTKVWCRLGNWSLVIKLTLFIPAYLRVSKDGRGGRRRGGGHILPMDLGFGSGKGSKSFWR